MRVVIIASEAVPFAKTGGLADVAGALPKELYDLGIEPILMIPYYRKVINGRYDIKRLRRVKVNMGVTSKTGSVLSGSYNGSKIKTYFIGYDAYFNRPGLYQKDGIDYDDNVERFTFFCRSAVEAIKELDLQPDIIHCNDWQTGLIPKYLKTLFADDFPDTKTVFTIHNLAFQGNFDKKYFPITGLDWDQFSLEDMEFFGQFSFIKAGIINADIVTTVSETYAEEIQTPEFGHGMDGILRERKKELYGILNGIDYSTWNPSTDECIPANYSADELSGKQECKRRLLEENGLPDDDKPLVGMVTRIADQKGFDIIVEGVDRILGMNCRYIMLGEGEIKYHRLFKEIADRHPKKFVVHLEFDEKMAHRIYAGSDIFLMPSRYEPCGLGQMISLAYGTVPVVRETGGMADTIDDVKEYPQNGVGFTFKRYTSRAMVEALRSGVEAYKDKITWNQIVVRGMRREYSWLSSAQKYLSIYNELCKK